MKVEVQIFLTFFILGIYCSKGQDWKVTGISFLVIYYRLIRKFSVRMFWSSKIAPRNWNKQLPAECEDLEINLHPVEKRYIVGDVGRYNEHREFYNFLARKMKVKK